MWLLKVTHKDVREKEPGAEHPAPAALVVPGQQAGEEPRSAPGGQDGRCQDGKIFVFFV